MGTSSGRRVGRSRAAQRRDSGLEPRAELLSAAAELFTARGYEATTNRAVAERAGMRQASMYHYVSGKEELLVALLESTVTPSLTYARELLADDARTRRGRPRTGCGSCAAPTGSCCAAARTTSAGCICCPRCAPSGSRGSMPCARN